MATLNQFICLTSAGNTGVVPCFFDPKNIIGAFLTPKGAEVDVASLQSALVAKTHATSAAARWYPLYDFVATTDATEQKTIQTFPTGAKKVVREGYNDWTFQFVEGGLSLLSRIRKQNGSNWDFIFVDAGDPTRGQALIGIVGSTATKLKAIPSDGMFFWGNPWKANDGSKITEYTAQFGFKSLYVNNVDLIRVAVATFDLPTTVKGLQDVVLTNPSATTAGLFRVALNMQATQGNLGDTYATELSVAGAWLMTNTATGAAITITGVTYSTTGGYFILTANTGDTDYPTPPATVTINLNTPSALQAIGVDGYESTGTIAVATVA